MANLINQFLINGSTKQPVVAPQQANNSNVDTTGSVKPLSDKGRLLPSKIIGSPIEYVKDLRKDVVSIGKAAKGKANDHELGRLNDLAMKAGSAALAAYLFIKNPLKLSKTMEFVGFGTFFASMALWPKLAIQAPLKARTGVDIHQKYIDSQGRKKMLFQDPQYDLTDMYSKEDLNRIGKKLKVSENIPDREKYIKQRAKKTAVQGNTLWMLTAGFASPVMSALACNAAEKPLNKLIEQLSIFKADKALSKLASGNGTIGAEINGRLAALEKYLSQNADKTIDEKMINEIVGNLFPDVNSASLQEELRKYITNLVNTSKIQSPLSLDAVKRMLPKVSKEQLSLLTEEDLTGSVNEIIKKISEKCKVSLNEKEKAMLRTKLQNAQKNSMVNPPLSKISESIKNLGNSLKELASGRKIIDRFINARVGDQSGTYIANQWVKTCNKLIKSLKLSNNELKALMNGDVNMMTSVIERIASGDPQKYNKLISDLMSCITDYETTTGKSFISQVESSTKQVCESARTVLTQNGFGSIADKVKSEKVAGTIENSISNYAKERAMGAGSSFYRLVQFIDLIKQDKSGVLTDKVTKALQEKGKSTSADSVQRIVKACKTMLMEATPTDYVEKLTNSRFKLDGDEYKIVMDIVFGGSDETIRSALGTAGETRVKGALDGLKSYKEKFIDRVVNWKNGMTPELASRTGSTATSSMNAVERSNLAGKPLNELLKESAEKAFNSRKWMKIFGGGMLVLTLATIIIGLTFGRKSKAEKQAEEESKVNG